MVSVLALYFYFDDPSSNPAGYLNSLCEKTKMNRKRPGLAHLKKTKWDISVGQSTTTLATTAAPGSKSYIDPSLTVRSMPLRTSFLLFPRPYDFRPLLTTMTSRCVPPLPLENATLLSVTSQSTSVLKMTPLLFNDLPKSESSEGRTGSRRCWLKVLKNHSRLKLTA